MGGGFPCCDRLFADIHHHGVACGIPLAAGVFFPLLGWQLSPMFGAAAMSLSSVCVCTNALRLRGFRPKLCDRIATEAPHGEPATDIAAVA